jgi:hypothetical protein
MNAGSKIKMVHESALIASYLANLAGSMNVHSRGTSKTPLPASAVPTRRCNRKTKQRLKSLKIQFIKLGGSIYLLYLSHGATPWEQDAATAR